MAFAPTKRKTVKRQRTESAEITEAVGYIRVSHADQVESGLGLAAQRERIEAYCVAKGWTLVRVHEDAGISGKDLHNRPALVEAVNSLRPGRILVASKLDRLTRTASDLNELTEYIEGVRSAWCVVEGQFDTSSATGRFMVRMIAELAEMERGIIAERVCAALAVKSHRGERLGTTPLGYRTEAGPDGPVVVEDPEELETVRLARELRASGLSFRKVAAALVDAGRPTKRGGKWEAATVKRLIEPRYIERTGNHARGDGAAAPAA